jgi:ABC-type phosphate transport system substrate-binding protein
MSKTSLLTGASLLIAASLSIAGAAGAQTSVYGGGAALAAPYFNEVESCFGIPDYLDTQASAGPGTPGVQNASLPTTCAAPFGANTYVHYMASTSSYGVAALYSNSPSFFGLTSTSAKLVTPDAYYAGAHYGLSDYGLAASDLAIYDNGGTEGTGSTAVTVVAPGVTPAAGQYANPQQTYGSLVQIPLLVAPVAFTYNPVYEATYKKGKITTKSFNIYKVNKNKDKSGGLLLDIPTLCGIFNGVITNWNDPALTYLNGNISLTGGKSVPIELVGRSDSSGTTSILYRALAAQCNGFVATGGDDINYVNQYLTSGGKTLPPGLIGQTWAGPGNPTLTPIPGKFTVTKGNANIAAYLALSPTPTAANPTVTSGKLGYLGPDFVLPAVTKTQANTYNLNVVDLLSNGLRIEPTAASALLAFGSSLPPQSSSTGAFVATTLGYGQRIAPQDWAQPISTTETLSTGVTVNTPLANPSSITGAYPVTGTTDGDFYTCYASPAVASAVQAFLTYYETNTTVTSPTTGLLAQAGLSPLPLSWRTAILQTFVTPVTSGSGATNQLNLNILAAHTPAGAGGFGGQCASVAGGV